MPIVNEMQIALGSIFRRCQLRRGSNLFKAEQDLRQVRTKSSAIVLDKQAETLIGGAVQ